MTHPLFTLQPLLLRGLRLLTAPLTSLHQTQLSGESHQYLDFIITESNICVKCVQMYIAPHPWPCKKCDDLITLILSPPGPRWHTDTFCPGAHLSYLDEMSPAKSHEILMWLCSGELLHLQLPHHPAVTQERPAHDVTIQEHSEHWQKVKIFCVEGQIKAF